MNVIAKIIYLLFCIYGINKECRTNVCRTEVKTPAVQSLIFLLNCYIYLVWCKNCSPQCIEQNTKGYSISSATKFFNFAS